MEVQFSVLNTLQPGFVFSFSHAEFRIKFHPGLDRRTLLRLAQRDFGKEQDHYEGDSHHDCSNDEHLGQRGTERGLQGIQKMVKSSAQL